MSSNLAIEARGLGKTYLLFERQSDRLKHLLWGRWLPHSRQYAREYHALHDVNFTVARGEVVGIVGRNGAGKSTLLQMVCGTLTPSSGSLIVNGRIAALLELGAGFNPDFTGLENLYMSAAIHGLNHAQITEKLDEILAFADIGRFIHQPVKTYSSGMFVRLAFSVATSVSPEILVIDEALSVGDGAFSRKSFDRIMALKDAGSTILFCSHTMYQIEALCSRVIWIENGAIRMLDTASRVTAAYEAALTAELGHINGHNEGNEIREVVVSNTALQGTARFTDFEAVCDGVTGRKVSVRSRESNLALRMAFISDPELPCPSLAVSINHISGVIVSSAGSANDGVHIVRDASGAGAAILHFSNVPLLKGDYFITLVLFCEKGLHIYEHIERAIALEVIQTDLEQGLVSLAHQWNFLQ